MVKIISLSQLSDTELQEKIDKYKERADRFSLLASTTINAVYYVARANLYQNELILRELRRVGR